jgi:hypothetical protein
MNAAEQLEDNKDQSSTDEEELMAYVNIPTISFFVNFNYLILDLCYTKTGSITIK